MGENYSKDILIAVLKGDRQHTPRKKKGITQEPKKVNLLVNIQAKLSEGRGAGYAYALGKDNDGDGEPDAFIYGPLGAEQAYWLLLRADVEAGYDVSGLTRDQITLNGINKAVDYGENFDASIGCGFVLPSLTADDTDPAVSTVTVNGSYASATGAGEYEEGDIVTLDAGSGSGYTFSGWTSDDITIPNANNADTSFVMPAKNVTVTATWTSTGGGSASAPTYSVTIPEKLKTAL